MAEGESFVYAPLLFTGNNNNYWAVAMDYVSFNMVTYTDLEANSAMIDSGTSSIVMCPEDYNYWYNNYLKKVDSTCNDAADAETCSCTPSTIANYPSLAVFINGNFLTIEPEYYLNYDTTTDTCNYWIQSGSFAISSEYNGWILGMPFLRKYYTLFSQTNNQIGFVAAAWVIF